MSVIATVPGNCVECLSETEMKYLAVGERKDANLQGVDGSASKRLVWVPHEEYGFAVASVKEDREEEVVVQVCRLRNH